VAVANDASATHWNPAGLGTAGPLGMTVGTSRFQLGNQKDAPQPGPSRGKANLVSFGSLPLGVSYGTFQVSTLGGAPDALRAETINIRQYALTILQSVFPGVTVGSTLKLLRGYIVTQPAEGASAGDVLEAAAELEAPRDTTYDLDLGVMATSDFLRIGFTFKNLRSPTFGLPTDLTPPLPRQARLGFAVTPGAGLTLATDLDLNTVDLVGGSRRNMAVGGEIALGSHMSARSGIRWSLVEAKRPLATVGLSIRVRRGLWVDGHYAKGRLDEDQEAGVAMRAGF
jgi:hypothetical protein